jgi:hypothetical protein
MTILLGEMTLDEIGERMGLSRAAIKKWQEYRQGRGYAWRPPPHRREELKELAREVLASTPKRKRKHRKPRPKRGTR